MTEGRATPEEIAREIDELREEMTPLVEELDRRRRAALDWKLQARQHLVPVVIGTAVVAGAATWLIWSAIEERHERRRPIEKARRLRRAFSRAIDEPERVAAADPAGMRSVGIAMARAAGTVAAAAFARRAVARLSAART